MNCGRETNLRVVPGEFGAHSEGDPSPPTRFGRDHGDGPGERSSDGPPGESSVHRTAVDSERAVEETPPRRALDDQYRPGDAESDRGDDRYGQGAGRDEDRERRDRDAGSDPDERVDPSDVSFHAVGSWLLE